MLAEILLKILADEYAEKGEQPYRRRPSSAGPERCIRQMVYHAKDTPKKPLGGRAISVFDDGHWHEDLVKDAVRKSIYQLHSEQMELSTPVGKGHIDGLFTDLLSYDYMLENKSISHFGYARLLKQDWLLDHLAQTDCYLASKEAAEHGITKCCTVYKNKNQGALLDIVSERKDGHLTVLECTTSSTCETEPVNYTLEWTVEDSIAKFDEVDRHVEEGTLPDRPYQWDHWRCEYCRYAGHCWEGFEKEFEELKTNQMLPNEFADMVRYERELLAQQGDMKKERDGLREKIKAVLTETGSKSGIAGEYVISKTLKPYEKVDRDTVPRRCIKQTFSERLDIKKLPEVKK